ncbi:hypothetical protein NDU88_007476 [Pleurodeles waltl]|uniref:Uncharacterized protein n=1 Tax=Pleurodeles waltl TaxID=8319 RepID=A0AAV7SSH6_PLEWA|nr:hypothetical protein NDU88_007476 [Pleurodeles waltl]
MYVCCLETLEDYATGLGDDVVLDLGPVHFLGNGDNVVDLLQTLYDTDSIMYNARQGCRLGIRVALD